MHAKNKNKVFRMTKEINLFDREIEQYIPSKPEEKERKQVKEKELQQQHTHIKRIIESLLFSSCTPIGFSKIQDIIESFYPIKPRFLREIIQLLSEEYILQDRAFRLEQIAEGYILRTCHEFSPYIEMMHRNRRTEKLSQASAEVLAIIAYRQPITRPQIDAIRGVDSSGILYTLMERQLIEPVGKLDAPGRPTLYGVTKDFLQYFGLKDIKDLPQI